MTIVHHATFFINSLCHYVGRRTYDFKSTARDSWIVSWFTFGEGYHNYHHKFQWDYRNGVKWFAYDPSKWIINGLSYFGITYDLKKVKEHVIMQNHFNSIRTQLTEKFNKSTKSCKVFYKSKVDQLHLKADSLFSSWDAMEMRYNQLVVKGKAKNKALMKELKNERRQYKTQLNKIKRSLNSIMLDVQKNRLRSELSV